MLPDRRQTAKRATIALFAGIWYDGLDVRVLAKFPKKKRREKEVDLQKNIRH
jgi:hypothetical protein